MNMRRFFQLFVLLLLILPIYATDFVIPPPFPLPGESGESKVPLSGRWQFNPSPEKNFWEKQQVNHWKNIEVPGEWVMQGFEVERKGRLPAISGHLLSPRPGTDSE